MVVASWSVADLLPVEEAHGIMKDQKSRKDRSRVEKTVAVLKICALCQKNWKVNYPTRILQKCVDGYRKQLVKAKHANGTFNRILRVLDSRIYNITKSLPPPPQLLGIHAYDDCM